MFFGSFVPLFITEQQSTFEYSVDHSITMRRRLLCDISNERLFLFSFWICILFCVENVNKKK